MDHFAGLDVSVKETSVCIVDDTGKIVREVKVASEPEALRKVLRSPSHQFKDPNVRDAYLNMAASWRRMAVQQQAIDEVLGDLRTREE